MRVTAVQYWPEGRDLVASRAALARLAHDAACDADLVVLPELAATPYLHPSAASARRIAEPPDGPTFHALAPAARRGAWIVAGFAEDAGPALYNSALVIAPDGALAAVYRKTLLYPPDAWWCAPGDTGYLAFDTATGRFGVGICMDLNDDRFTAWIRDAALDVVAFPTNWVDDGSDVLDYWHERMMGCDAALVAANAYGSEGRVSFSGRSAVLHRGRALAVGPRSGAAIVRATVPRSALAAPRSGP